MNDRLPSAGDESDASMSLFAPTGALQPTDADALISQGVPWHRVAPFVNDREWWRLQKPLRSTNHPYSVSLRVWDATVCICTRETVAWIDPGPEAPDPTELPPKLAPDLLLVSHAHHDHTASLAKYSETFPDAVVLMTEHTANLLELEQPALSPTTSLRRRTRNLDYLGDFVAGDLTIKLLPAGHLLGAAMVDLRSPGGSLLVTGDFALRDVGGLAGAAWPDGPYDLLLMEATQSDPQHLPVMDMRTTRQPILDALAGACSRGMNRLVIPALAKGEAQEVYAAIVAAQQRNEFADLDVGLDGLAFHVALEYYEIFCDKPGPWRIRPMQIRSRGQRAKSVVIRSAPPSGDTKSDLAGKDPVQSDGIEPLAVTAYTHAGWSERLAFGLGVDCQAVATYHGASLSLHQDLRICGREVIQLARRGDVWTPQN
jgi:hypothetical protein